MSARSFYYVRMPDTFRGPKKCIVTLRLGGAAIKLRFNAFQTDETAIDFPKKRAFISEENAAELTGKGFEVRPAKPPQEFAEKHKPRRKATKKKESEDA